MLFLPLAFAVAGSAQTNLTFPDSTIPPVATDGTHLSTQLVISPYTFGAKCDAQAIISKYSVTRLQLSGNTVTLTMTRTSGSTNAPIVSTTGQSSTLIPSLGKVNGLDFDFPVPITTVSWTGTSGTAQFNYPYPGLPAGYTLDTGVGSFGTAFTMYRTGTDDTAAINAAYGAAGAAVTSSLSMQQAVNNNAQGVVSFPAGKSCLITGTITVPVGVATQGNGVTIYEEGTGDAFSYLWASNSATQFTGTTTAGSSNVSAVSSTADLSVPMSITGAGIPSNTIITSVLNSSSITLSTAATTSGTAIPLSAAGSYGYGRFYDRGENVKVVGPGPFASNGKGLRLNIVNNAVFHNWDISFFRTGLSAEEMQYSHLEQINSYDNLVGCYITSRNMAISLTSIDNTYEAVNCRMNAAIGRWDQNSSGETIVKTDLNWNRQVDLRLGSQPVRYIWQYVLTSAGSANTCSANATVPIVISDTTVVQPTITPTLDGSGHVSSVAISGGSGYAISTNLPLYFSDSSNGDAAQGYVTTDSSGDPTSVSLTHGGSGYTAAPTVKLPGGTGEYAQAYLQTNSNGVGVAAYGLNGGMYYNNPTATLPTASASVTFTIVSGAITGATISGGAGYPPSQSLALAIPAPSSGTTAQGFFTTNPTGVPSSVAITNGGTGYTTLSPLSTPSCSGPGQPSVTPMVMDDWQLGDWYGISGIIRGSNHYIQAKMEGEGGSIGNPSLRPNTGYAISIDNDQSKGTDQPTNYGLPEGTMRGTYFDHPDIGMDRGGASFAQWIRNSGYDPVVDYPEIANNSIGIANPLTGDNCFVTNLNTGRGIFVNWGPFSGKAYSAQCKGNGAIDNNASSPYFQANGLDSSHMGAYGLDFFPDTNSNARVVSRIRPANTTSDTWELMGNGSQQYGSGLATTDVTVGRVSPYVYGLTSGVLQSSPVYAGSSPSPYPAGLSYNNFSVVITSNGLAGTGGRVGSTNIPDGYVCQVVMVYTGAGSTYLGGATCVGNDGSGVHLYKSPSESLGSEAWVPN